ncbi:SNF2 family N-terminal domain-containing protein [Cryptosporidium muris RN66]|uniref:SNF2 family N-terminal domain-containing protein n=1 Tax=Cryptosporidium muris (strain RN66) TaxID=441375 RepID=B6AJB2_CRYMR|nr:SNF2 family N-terminal domain-containing protein [Cryptosporidium muris RN66]EEA08250.1 SNF2 family N-terminal domain-containing protein [Cryptosporidium muris RN66]|eukprot:XP_002142599.1 SNF2 family N-terminal domain-containing protein [Cryptosporidium muris RN66]
MDLDVEFSDSSTDSIGNSKSTKDVKLTTISRDESKPKETGPVYRSRSGRVTRMKYSNFSNIDEEDTSSEETSLDSYSSRREPRMNNRRQITNLSRHNIDNDYEDFNELDDGDNDNEKSSLSLEKYEDDDDTYNERDSNRRKNRKDNISDKKISKNVPRRTSGRERRSVNYASYADSSDSSASSMISDNLKDIDSILLDRNEEFLQVPVYSRNIDRILSHRINPESKAVEYQVKWSGYSHLHNTWETPESLLSENTGGMRRLENYQRKVTETENRRKYMTEDEIEQEDITFEIQKQLDLDALIPERIVDEHTDYIEDEFVNKATEEKKRLETRYDKFYFVKWLSCSYDQCTWESYKTLEDNNFLSYIKAFHRRMDLVTQYNKDCDYTLRRLGLTSFEPYLSTPFYMGTIVEGMKELTKKHEDILESVDIQKKENPRYMDEIKEREVSEITGNLNGTYIFQGTESVKKELIVSEENKESQSSEVVENKDEDSSDSLSSNYINQRKDLRDYQIYGLNWMISRFKKNVNILLADEMGLGKTVQTISVIGHCLYMEKIVAPFLVVVPQSTSDNWIREFKHWLPDANVVLYHGNAQAREIIREYELRKVDIEKIDDKESVLSSDNDEFVPYSNKKIKGKQGKQKSSHKHLSRYRFDVVITTPSILNSPVDCDFLRQIDWYMMIVDEAHQLKNRDSKRFKELHEFSTMYRLLLSGTPLHNNLEELWSLLHFLNPQKFIYYQEFRERYPDIENPNVIGSSKQQQLENLQNELQEYVLRRVKKDVEKSLPNKVERILRIELSPQQTVLYKSILTRNYEELSKTTGGTKTSLQNICMELKKVCNHPFLIHRPEVDSSQGITPATIQHQLIYGCGKLCLLDKLLSRLKEKGNRVLIFSQMVRMLNIISEFLILRGFRHQRLDGTMGKELRKKAMDHFNSPNSDDFCFLLSTKAGGLGINLTTADTVIIYDSDWNPQNDLQAEARAHRIGQTKQVQIYRLVTKDSIEENILERAKTKMVLDTLVVQGLNNTSTGSHNKHQSHSTSIAAANIASQLLYPNGKKSGSGASFSRDELAKILKFGAQKLWSNKVNNANEGGNQHFSEEKGDNAEYRVANVQNDEDRAFASQIDLDKVLADAEEHVHDTQGLADGLLRSFANIADFRYEAPPLIIDKNTGILKQATETNDDNQIDFDSKEFWEKTIPEEERKKIEEENRKSMIVTGPRKSAMRDGSLRYKGDSYTLVGNGEFTELDTKSLTDFNGDLDDIEESGGNRKKQTKKRSKEKSLKNKKGSSKSKSGSLEMSPLGPYNKHFTDTNQVSELDSAITDLNGNEANGDSQGFHKIEYPMPIHSLESRDDFAQLMAEITNYSHVYCEEDEGYPFDSNKAYREVSFNQHYVRSGKRMRRDSRVLHPKRRFKLFRALLKYGDPYRRLDDIMLETRFKGRIDHGIILNEAQIIIALCFEKIKNQSIDDMNDNKCGTSNKLGEVEISDTQTCNTNEPAEIQDKSISDFNFEGDVHQNMPTGNIGTTNFINNQDLIMKDIDISIPSENKVISEHDINKNNINIDNIDILDTEEVTEDIETQGQLSIVGNKTLKKNSLLLGNNRANAPELIDRLRMLTALDKLMRECNPGINQPWKLSTGPLPRPNRDDIKRDEEEEEEDEDEDEEEDPQFKSTGKKPNLATNNIVNNQNIVLSQKFSNTSTIYDSPSTVANSNPEEKYLQLELPPILIKALRTPTWGIPWSVDIDINILKGIYVYGFANWTMMSLDQNLCLSSIQQVKFDKLKQRTLRIMKHLYSVVSIGKTARKKRRMYTGTSNEQDGESIKCEVPSSKRRKNQKKLDVIVDEEDYTCSNSTPRPLTVGGRKGLPEVVVDLLSYSR